MQTNERKNSFKKCVFLRIQRKKSSLARQNDADSEDEACIQEVDLMGARTEWQKAR